MELWVQVKGPDGEVLKNKFGEPIEKQVDAKMSEMTAKVNRQVVSRATRALNALRSAQLDVLRGQRSGRVYRKYPQKSKYTASAPGEAPARRTGALRLHWNGNVETRPKNGGMEVTAVFESGEVYAKALEEGSTHTKRGHYVVAPRPFVDRIIERAKPGILKIYGEPYK